VLPLPWFPGLLAYHSLFCTDFYLSDDEKAFQAIHDHEEKSRPTVEPSPSFE
jgi:hypothetical protein